MAKAVKRNETLDGNDVIYAFSGPSTTPVRTPKRTVEQRKPFPMLTKRQQTNRLHSICDYLEDKREHDKSQVGIFMFG